jgi:uncharacterized protein YbjQ (UPF0145 family)
MTTLVKCLVTTFALAALATGCSALRWHPRITARPGRAWSGPWSGGSVGARYRAVDPPPTPTDPSRVLLLAGSAEEPCEVLGLVDEQAALGDEGELLERMRHDAARLGADAVVHVRFEHGTPGDREDGRDLAARDEVQYADLGPDGDAHVDESADDAMHLSGTAVRYRDLVDGRRYEVIELIEVTDRMGREEEALDRLRARATRVRADLVLSVRFDHDEASETVVVTGTAVRFTD